MHPSIERQSILLPPLRSPRRRHLRIRSTEGEAAGSTLPIPMESMRAGIPLAIQNAERGRADLRSLLAIAAATTLPGRHSPRVVVSGRDEEVMTLSRLDDSAASLFGAKFTCVWARESGIETAQTRLKDVAEALHPSRAALIEQSCGEAALHAFSANTDCRPNGFLSRHRRHLEQRRRHPCGGSAQSLAGEWPLRCLLAQLTP